VAPLRERAEWHDTVTRQIDELARLEFGWDGYRAVAISGAVIIEAKRFIADIAVPSIPAPAVVPTTDGHVQFEWHTRRGDAEVEILETGTCHVFVQPIESEPWEEQNVADDCVLDRLGPIFAA
jgi:hypothetical protein